MAPEIVLLHDDYFVMKAVGKTLQGVAKEAPWQDVRRKAFYKAGEALGKLHGFGLHHGRPALRDIAYDREKDSVTLFDWENEKRFIDADPRVIDLFLFVHSCFREKWALKNDELIREAMKGYFTGPESRPILEKALAVTKRFQAAFTLAHHLRIFGWTDVTSLDDAKNYLFQLDPDAL